MNRPGAKHFPTQFGVAFVETAIAESNLATFVDGRDRTKFETLITQIKPMEIVIEKGGLSAPDTRILKNSLGANAIRTVYSQNEGTPWSPWTSFGSVNILERTYLELSPRVSEGNHSWNKHTMGMQCLARILIQT
jgi:DNA mismatch repair protein MSH6